MPSEVVHLGNSGVVIGALPLLAGIAASRRFLHLGLEGKFLLATARCYAQLTALGYILMPLFESRSLPLLIGYVLLMTLVAAFECHNRLPYTFRWSFLVVWGGVVIFTLAPGAYGLVAVIGIERGGEPQYAIPILGMLMGNSINAQAVTLSTVLSDVKERHQAIEYMLAIGATWWEAWKEVIVKAVTLGLMPTANMLMVIGLVSIPGMMTGQILGGENVVSASQYQAFIAYLIATTAGASSVSLAILSVRLCSDVASRPLPESLERKEGFKVATVVSWFRLSALPAIKRLPSFLLREGKGGRRGASRQGEEEGENERLVANQA